MPLRDLIAATFSSNVTENLRSRYGVCEGDLCLRPVAVSGGDGLWADAHASGLRHALNVGGGQAMPEELLAGLANERAGIDLTTVGHVLQAADKRMADGQDVDTIAVTRALKTVVRQLNHADLPGTARGNYNGTRVTERLVGALGKLRTETEKLIVKMGGVGSVLQDIAATQVHDRLLQKIQERFPGAFAENGEWIGMDDESGYTYTPTDFLNREAIDRLQRMSDSQNSLPTFAQLQGKAQELLKLSDLILRPDDGPEDPPAPNRTPSPAAGPHRPEPGANWNWNGGARAEGGNVTISPGAFQSSAANEAAMLKALEVIDLMDERKTAAFSEALQVIYNMHAATNGKQANVRGPSRAPVMVDAVLQADALKSDDLDDVVKRDSAFVSRESLLDDDTDEVANVSERRGLDEGRGDIFFGNRKCLPIVKLSERPVGNTNGRTLPDFEFGDVDNLGSLHHLRSRSSVSVDDHNVQDIFDDPLATLGSTRNRGTNVDSVEGRRSVSNREGQRHQDGQARKTDAAVGNYGNERRTFERDVGAIPTPRARLESESSDSDRDDASSDEEHHHDAGDILSRDRNHGRSETASFDARGHAEGRPRPGASWFGNTANGRTPPDFEFGDGDNGRSLYDVRDGSSARENGRGGEDTVDDLPMDHTRNHGTGTDTVEGRRSVSNREGQRYQDGQARNTDAAVGNYGNERRTFERDVGAIPTPRARLESESSDSDRDDASSDARDHAEGGQPHTSRSRQRSDGMGDRGLQASNDNLGSRVLDELKERLKAREEAGISDEAQRELDLMDRKVSEYGYGGRVLNAPSRENENRRFIGTTGVGRDLLSRVPEPAKDVIGQLGVTPLGEEILRGASPVTLKATVGIGSSPMDNLARNEFRNIYPQFNGDILHSSTPAEPSQDRPEGAKTVIVSKRLPGGLYTKFYYEKNTDAPFWQNSEPS
jgi:hypothetical protein